MIRSLCLAAALAVVLAPSAAFARAKHGHMKHARTTAMHDNANVIDRCSSMHYSEKVSCLTRSRGGPNAAYSNATAMMTSGTGGTSSSASGSGASSSR
jgi:hypothetical protein